MTVLGVLSDSVVQIGVLSDAVLLIGVLSDAVVLFEVTKVALVAYGCVNSCFQMGLPISIYKRCRL